MLAMVQIDYTAYDIIKAMSREDYLALGEAVPQLCLTEWKEGKNEAPHNYFNSVLVDLSTDGVALAKHGIKFMVIRFKGTYKAKSSEVSENHSHLHIAIPAIGLLCMDEVMLLDDACTDSLNSYLKEGWRMVAVCPPDAQRRPDYILGRSPDMRDKYGA